MTTTKRHLDITVAGRFAIANLNGAIAVALDLEDQPVDLEWERDPDTEDGWVAVWGYSESVDDVRRWLEANFDVTTRVTSERPGHESHLATSWLWIAPSGEVA